MVQLEPSSPEGEWFVRWTIRLALILYFAAVAGLLALRGRREPPSWIRLAWTLAWLTYLVHVVAAFGVYHHWSHFHAYQHTQAVSGFGPGIFVSYFFTLVWGLDIAWSWFAPQQHWRLPTWLVVVFHALLAFIIFNGAIVFATGPVRWASLAGAALLLALLVCRIYTQARPVESHAVE